MGGNVSISGIHFTRGLASAKGGAISNSGTLALRSCVFSRNNASGSATGDGGGRTTVIDVSPLAAGVYLVKAGRQTAKIVVR